MNPFFIKETQGTPEIEFSPEGILSMRGRSLPLDSVGFYYPIIQWIKEIKVPEVQFTIQMDYLNTGSAKQLYAIFRILKDNPCIKSLRINWCYEEDDEDGYDTGCEFEIITGLEFHFFACSGEAHLS